MLASRHLWFASLMTGRLTVRGAMLFCGLTHPEAIAAGRQRIPEPMSEKLSKFSVPQAPICWQADLLWFASLMTGRLTVRGAMLFCALTHPEAIAAGRQRILEPLSEKLSKFGVSQVELSLACLRPRYVRRQTFVVCFLDDRAA